MIADKNNDGHWWRLWVKKTQKNYITKRNNRWPFSKISIYDENSRFAFGSLNFMSLPCVHLFNDYLYFICRLPNFISWYIIESTLHYINWHLPSSAHFDIWNLNHIYMCCHHLGKEQLLMFYQTKLDASTVLSQENVIF